MAIIRIKKIQNIRKHSFYTRDKCTYYSLIYGSNRTVKTFVYKQITDVKLN